MIENVRGRFAKSNRYLVNSKIFGVPLLCEIVSVVNEALSSPDRNSLAAF